MKRAKNPALLISAIKKIITRAIEWLLQDQTQTIGIDNKSDTALYHIRAKVKTVQAQQKE